MAPPTDPFALPPTTDTLLTKAEKAMPPETPANPSRSCIVGLGTANPKPIWTMMDFGNFILKMYEYEDMPHAKSFVERICKASGIEQKRMAASVEIYREHPSLSVHNHPNLGERFQIYEPVAMEIGQLAAERALSDWGGDRGDITHLITYSTSMLLSPSLDLRLLSCLNLKPTVKHFCVSLLGCHGGVNGIRTAAEIAQADPNHRVLAVFVEINSVAAQTLDPADPYADMSHFLLNLLFGDGAGAVVVGKHPTKNETSIFEVYRALTYLIPGSSKSIAAVLLETGMHTSLERNVPALVGQHVGGFITELLHKTKLNFGSVNWACHPGGKGIVDAVEKNCKLKPEQLHASRSILRNYGNMGAATILFLLDKFRMDKKVDPTIHPWTAAIAFGPGITVEGLLLKFGSKNNFS